MSVQNCSVLVPDNALFGTANADQVRISKADGADGLAGKFKVEINGQTRIMDQAELEATRFELGAGDDTVTIAADVNAKIRLNGGTGTTHIEGNSRNVVDITGPDKSALPAPFRIPGTPLIVEPLEAARPGESLSLYGFDLPLRSARISNASCVTGLPSVSKNVDDAAKAFDKPTQPGQPTASLPRGSITVKTDGVRLDVTDRVRTSLRPDVVPGTPLHGKTDPANVRQNEIVDPSLSIGRRVHAAGTLSIRDPYPSHLIAPTEVQFDVTSDGLKNYRPVLRGGDLLDFGDARFHAQAFGIGGAKGDINVALDLTRIDAALKPLGLKPGEDKALRKEIVDVVAAKAASLSRNPGVTDIAAALGTSSDFARQLRQTIDKHVPPGTSPTLVDKVAKDVLAEATHPGVTVKGTLYMGLPVGYGYLHAETTRNARAPLDASGIGLPMPATLATVGVTRIPAGVITDFATPAGGFILARDWDRLAVSATVAGKPELNPGSIGAGGVASVRVGGRVGGFDVTAEGGWRGHAKLGGKGAPAVEDPDALNKRVRADYIGMKDSERAAVARVQEAAEGSEAGVMRPDMTPPSVVGNSQPDSEFFIGARVTKRW